MMEATKRLDGNESQQHIIARKYRPTRRSSSTSTSSEASAYHFQVDQKRYQKRSVGVLECPIIR